jgi:hypothetical protein
VADAFDVSIASSCVHHWLIDPPLGEVSHAVCKLCGALREFHNEPERTFYLRKSTQTREPQTGVT